MKKSKRKRKPSYLSKIKPLNDKCPYCADKTVPDYKDVEGISKYITERGKIMQRVRTGLCAKHQRRLAGAIKRARNVSLIPSTVTLQ